MARTSPHPPLNLFLNNRLVGQLNREKSGAIFFQYDQSWLSWQHAMPISLSLPLSENRYKGAEVLAVFDNLLPDNDNIRERIAAKREASGTDAYSLLSKIGRDCVGALQFLPIDTLPHALDDIKGEELSETDIEAILSDLKKTPLGLGDDKEFRISIAGVQEKSTFTYWKGRWILPHGTTATTHIFKPPMVQRLRGLDLKHSVENEYFCLMLCRNMGLPTANAEIEKFGEIPTLIIQRFDRQIDGQRIFSKKQYIVLAHGSNRRPCQKF